MAAKRKVDPELIDDDNPEWTAADFARARPASEVHSKEFLNNWEKNRQRKLNANGKGIGRPFKERPKVPVTVRLDADVVEFFRTGEGWQTRLNAFLAAHVKRASKRKPAKSGRKLA
jgi:uncharacterized protein (DUF4415 family)